MERLPVAVFLLVGASLLVSTFVPMAASAGTSGPNPPLGVHLGYLDDPTQAILTWHTASSSTSRVEWGTSPGPPDPFSAAGTDYTSTGGSFLHTVTLTGLTPNTLYYYRAGDASMASWFGEGTFRSAPNQGDAAAFSFAAAGDWGNTATTQATSNAIGAANPNLAFLLGDLYYSAAESTIQGVQQKWQSFGAKSFLMTAVGNHEYSDTGIAKHCSWVNSPGNERTYAFTYGNTFFITIDWGSSQTGTSDGVDGTGAPCGGVAGNAAIRSWVDARLAEANSNPAIRWKVAYHHFLCYLTDNDKTSALCPDGAGNPDQIEDIYVNRKVDFVLQAHAHTYGRTYPVKFNTVMQTGSAYTDPGAPIYLTIGTGGAPRTSTCRTNSYIAVCLAPTATAGYGKFTVSGASISYQFVKNGAGVVDSFSLTKASPTDFSLSVTPPLASVEQGQTTNAMVSVTGTSSNPVTLSQTGCPTNTSCTFAPASGTPPFSSTSTVSTTATSPLGTFPMTITGSNSTVSRTTTFTLTISAPQPFEFSMSANPSSATTSPGGSVQSTVTATLVSGTSETVTFSSADLPAGVTWSFQTTSCTPTCSSLATISTSAGSPLGSHVLKFVGTSTTKTKDTTFTLTLSTTVTVSFQKGDGGAYSETDDTYLYNGKPTGNSGTDAKLFVDASGCIASKTVCKTLIKFPDIIGAGSGQIPIGSAIQSASLELQVLDAGGTQDFYQGIETWQETTATWNSFQTPGSPGTMPKTGSFTPSSRGRITVVVTSIVQNWANGDANQGILISSLSTNGVDYASSEATTAANRPKLTLTFTPPAGPSAPLTSTRTILDGLAGHAPGAVPYLGVAVKAAWTGATTFRLNE